MNSMLSLKKDHTVNKFNSKSDFIEHSPTNVTTIKNNSSNIFISFSREDAYICFQNSYIAIEFEVL